MKINKASDFITSRQEGNKGKSTDICLSGLLNNFKQRTESRGPLGATP